MATGRMQDGEAFGVASVTEMLDSVKFPVRKDYLLKEYGERMVHWTQDSSQPLRTLLQDLPEDEFYSMSDVISAISHPSQA